VNKDPKGNFSKIILGAGSVYIPDADEGTERERPWNPDRMIDDDPIPVLIYGVLPSVLIYGPVAM